MQFCPSWCQNHWDCWTAIVDKWLSDEWAEMHIVRRECRLQMPGVPHHQGNLSLDAYAARWVRSTHYFLNSNAQYSLFAINSVSFLQSQSHGGAECNPFVAYHLAHKGKATAPDNQYNLEDGVEQYTNEAAYTKVTQYAAAARERYGPDYDPASQPLDTDLLMRLGGGKQHGRLYMADSSVSSDSVPSLAEIRSRSTSSSMPIRPRNTTIAQLQVSTVLSTFK